MNQKNDIAKYLRDMFGLLAIVGIWYLYQNHEEINNWFKLYLTFTIISAIFFVVLLIFKPSLHFFVKTKLPQNIFIIVSVLLIFLLVVAFYTLPQKYYRFGEARLVSLAVMAGVLGFVVVVTENDFEARNVILAALLFGAFIHQMGTYVITVQSTPFSLGWSEGSQIYNASTFHAQRVYGQDLPLTVLDPSRYMLQSIPFLFNIKSIEIHRLWQAILWVGLTCFGSWLIAKILGNSSKGVTFWLGTYIFLFFYQGPIYYNLVICYSLVMLGYKKGAHKRTLLFVILASIWAGLSRVNWIPLPALLAVCLYLLDEPINSKKLMGYLKWPIVWTVAGTAAAFVPKSAYRYLSGENPGIFDSAFSSPLLWERILPNATFAPGILIAILAACLPFLVLAILFKKDFVKQSVHWLRWSGLVTSLAIFFIGGLVVSVKIGGGSNLHNLDAFMVLFVVVLVGILSGRIAVENGNNSVKAINIRQIPSWLVFAIVLAPLLFTFSNSVRWVFEDAESAREEVAEIQNAMDSIAELPGEILFITERQLLATHAIEGVRVVSDYEKVMIMEMAMVNNQEYLQKFYRLLSEHHFKAILLDTLNTGIQGTEGCFAVENNTYVERVVIPILANYQELDSWHNDTIYLMVPKQLNSLLGVPVNLP